MAFSKQNAYKIRDTHLDIMNDIISKLNELTLEEREKITILHDCNFLSTVDELIDNENEKINLLNHYKQHIITVNDLHSLIWNNT